MGQFASEFIESKREILNEKEIFWSNELLFFTLNEAYIALQTDMPYCKDIKILSTKENKWQYHIDAILQPIKVIVDGSEYAVVSDTKFFDLKDSEDRICTVYDYALCLSKTPIKDGLTIDCRYKYLHKLEHMNCELKLPDHYMEALHNNFFSKVWEKNPKRGDRTLVNAYKRDYALSLESLSQWGRVKPRQTQSKFKKV